MRTTSSRARATKAPGLILLYHRVAEGVAADLFSVTVSPRRFAEQVDALAAEYDVVPLTEVFSGSPHRPVIAITFDDGYADNLDAARLLAARDLPATFFLTSGQLGSDREFWWDELARLVFEADIVDVRGLDLDGVSHDLPPPKGITLDAD